MIDAKGSAKAGTGHAYREGNTPLLGQEQALSRRPNTMTKANRKFALPVLGALCSVLLLGGFDGCNVNIYVSPNEPEVQPEPTPEPQPNPEPQPEPQPEPYPGECFSDDDCPGGTVCVFFEDGDECYGNDEPVCDPDGDGNDDCRGLVAPCGYGQCVDIAPQCEDDCFRNYDEIINECLENNGGADGQGDAIYPYDECFEYADQFLGQCLESCEEPPPPPQCEENCFQQYDMFINECFQWGGDEEECFREADEFLNYCLMDCDEPPPPPPQCEEYCFDLYEELIQECQYTDDPDCYAWVEEELNYCLMNCDEPPPPPPACEEDCFQQFEEILQECEQSGQDEECYRFAEENLEYCLMDCDQPPPPPMCEDDCFRNYEQIIQECYEGYGNDPDQPGAPIAPPEDCELWAEEFLGQCLESCDEPTTCEDRCIEDINGAFEECLASGQDPQVCEDILGPLVEECFASCHPTGGECNDDADCGDGQRCEIVEWCEGFVAPPCDDPSGENCDLPVDPNCGQEGICVEIEPPPPSECRDDADCGEGGRCEVQEYCYFSCDVNDDECCFEEAVCVYEGEPEPVDPDQGE